MNPKVLIALKLKEFQDAHPSYTIGQIFHAALSMCNKKRTTSKLKFVDLTDKELYEGLCQAYNNELEEAFSEEEVRALELKHEVEEKEKNSKTNNKKSV